MKIKNPFKYERTVWTEASPDDIYEPRCSYCGKYHRKFYFHWFFTGLYCVACINDVLYDNARNVEEIK